MFNYAVPKTQQTDIGPGLRTCYGADLATWRAGASNPALPNVTRIAQDITDTERTGDTAQAMSSAWHRIMLANQYGLAGNRFSCRKALTWNPDKAGFYQIKATAEDASGAKLTTPVKHVTMKAQN